jgi:hypothetical protein
VSDDPEPHQTADPSRWSDGAADMVIRAAKEARHPTVEEFRAVLGLSRGTCPRQCRRLYQLFCKMHGDSRNA